MKFEMTRQRFINVLKQLWIVVIFIGAAYYLISHRDLILDTISMVSWWKIIISIGFLIAGKMCLVQVSRYSLHGQTWQPDYPEMFQINSINQLAKYLPGGIWHFVSRAGIYKDNNMTPFQIGRAMMVENLWLVFSALFISALTSSSFFFNLLSIQNLPINHFLWLIAIISLSIVIFFLIDRFVSIAHHSVGWILVNPILFQSLSWVMIGLSFWIIFPVSTSDITFLLTSIGSFCLSWVAGFLAIFAPSGLGVRELLFPLLLGSYLPSETIIIFGALNRIIWVVVELLLGSISQLFIKGRKANPQPNHQ